MAIITDDMRQIIAATRLAFIATVNADGTPNLSPKSSLDVLDGNHLGFANIASPNTVQNLRTNPAIEINAIDIFARRGYRFAAGPRDSDRNHTARSHGGRLK